MNHRSRPQVLVTRPSPQGEALCDYLTAHEYAAIFFPVIAIQPISSPEVATQIAALDYYHLAIFISRAAVTTSAPLIHTQWKLLPPLLKWAAVGKGTAQALREAALPVDYHPETQWSSEGLLALPELQTVQGQKIALFRGEGGRELLAERLDARGALVTPMVTYRRVMPAVNVTPYHHLLQQQQIDVIVCTSGEGVENLKKMMGESVFALLCKIPLVLVSERIMIMAKALGFTTCVLAKDGTHASILEALQRTT